MVTYLWTLTVIYRINEPERSPSPRRRILRISRDGLKRTLVPTLPVQLRGDDNNKDITVESQ